MFPLRALAALGRDAELPRQMMSCGTTGLKSQERLGQEVQPPLHGRLRQAEPKAKAFLGYLDSLFGDTAEGPRLQLRSKALVSCVKGPGFNPPLNIPQSKWSSHGRGVRGEKKQWKAATES